MDQLLSVYASPPEQPCLIDRRLWSFKDFISLVLGKAVAFQRLTLQVRMPRRADYWIAIVETLVLSFFKKLLFQSW
jgi:hypothetical protein